MGDLYLTRDELEALGAIDSDAMGAAIASCRAQGHARSLRGMGLERCGPYVGNQLRAFETALSQFSAAKSAKKIASTLQVVDRAGRDLEFAFDRMKDRAQRETEESERFIVDDLIRSPYSFDERLSVTVSFRWRSAGSTAWQYSHIVFSYNVPPPNRFLAPASKRKASARAASRERQDSLFREWDHLKQSGLESVRDFFRQGGDGATIPATFQIRPSHTGGLDNHSTKFWPATTVDPS